MIRRQCKTYEFSPKKYLALLHVKDLKCELPREVVWWIWLILGWEESNRTQFNAFQVLHLFSLKDLSNGPIQENSMCVCVGKQPCFVNCEKVGNSLACKCIYSSYVPTQPLAEGKKTPSRVVCLQGFLSICQIIWVKLGSNLMSVNFPWALRKGWEGGRGGLLR